MEAETDAPVIEFHRINRNAQIYPAHLLPTGGTALCLFAAGFHGWNDVIHMIRKKMVVTCVDNDADKLWEMAQVYPSGLECHVEDAWEFSEIAALKAREWDVVSVDPFMGDAAEKAWDTRWLWTTLATKLVTLTVATDRPPFAPPGWSSHMFPRSDKASWMVLTHA